MAKKYKRLRFEDRQTMERMLKTGSSVLDVAQALGTCRDTIYRELARCGADRRTYNAEAAQRAL